MNTDPSSGSILTSTTNHIVSVPRAHVTVELHGLTVVSSPGFLHSGAASIEAPDRVRSRGTVTFTADTAGEKRHIYRSAPIARPPGEGAIRWFAELVYSPETAERQVGQLLADLEHEYRAAQGGRRAWIVFKYWAAFLSIVLAPLLPVFDRVLSIIEKVSSILK